MTLIVSLATAGFIIQVGDTRLVAMQPDGRFRLFDDAANKLTWFDGRIAFGYSGVAHIASERTDRWIAAQLIGKRFKNEIDPLLHLKNRLEAVFRSSLIDRRHKRLAIAGLAWCAGGTENSEYPAIYEISNFRGPQGNILGEARDVFQLTTRVPDFNERFRLLFTGWQPPENDARTLNKRIKRGLRRDDPPEAILELLVAFVRDCARKTDTIGKHLLSVYIPANSKGTVQVFAGQPSMTMVTNNSQGKPISMAIGGPLSESATFHSWPATSNTSIPIAPNIATGATSSILTAMAQAMAPMTQSGPPPRRKPQENELVPEYEVCPASRFARKGEGLTVHCEFSGLPAGVAPAIGKYELVLQWDRRELVYREISFCNALGGLSDPEGTYDLLPPGEYNPHDGNKAAIVFRDHSRVDVSELVRNQPSRIRLATIRFRSLTDDPIWLGGGFTNRGYSIIDASTGKPIVACTRVKWVNK